MTGCSATGSSAGAVWRRFARAWWLAIRVALSVGLLLAAPAAAAPSPVPDAACPAGNLLAKAAVVSSSEEARGLATWTDGVVAREGAAWPPPSVMHASGEKTLVFDLGRSVPVRAILVQADADAELTLGLSETGSQWHRYSLPTLPSSGLRTRFISRPGTAARYSLVASAHPTAGLAATEIALYCQPPGDPGQSLEVAEHAESRLAPGWLSPVWRRVTGTSLPDHRHVAVFRLLLLIATLLVIGAAWLGRRGSPSDSPGRDATSRAGPWGIAAMLARPRQRRIRDGLLVTLALLSVFAYFNFGGYHLPGFPQKHDTFHYFVGSKYFPELGYTRLYHCAALAEVEAGFEPRVQLRHQRDLQSNALIAGAVALKRAEECRRRFSPARWESFARDVGYFANAHSVDNWHRILRDHGFNASPLWIALGGSIAEPLPAVASTIGHGDSLFGGLLPLLDLALLVIGAVAVWWAFGWRFACFAVVVFGCNPLSEFLWVGGAFLRQPWFVALVWGICLLRKKWWVSGGVLLATAALLRLFPVLCLLPVAMLILLAWWQRRQVPRAGLRVVFGAALATVVLLPCSVWVVGVPDAWAQFLHNTLKHAATPSANLVGLPAALSFRLSTRAELLFDAAQTDAFAAIRAARVETLKAMRPLHLGMVAAALYGVYRALRRKPEWWRAAALGLTLVPIVFQLSCYYYSLLTVLVLLGQDRRGILSAVLFCLVATTAVELATEPTDVRYAIWSWIVVAAAAVVLVLAERPGLDKQTPYGRGKMP